MRILMTLLALLAAAPAAAADCEFSSGTGPTLRIANDKTGYPIGIDVDAGLGVERCLFSYERPPADLGLGSGWLPAKEATCRNPHNGRVAMKGQFGYVFDGPDRKDIAAVFFNGNVFYRDRTTCQ